MKNILDYRDSLRLKEAGFPAPELKSGQYWYIDKMGVVGKDYPPYVINFVGTEDIYFSTVGVMVSVTSHVGSRLKIEMFTGAAVFAPTFMDLVDFLSGSEQGDRFLGLSIGDAMKDGLLDTVLEVLEKGSVEVLKEGVLRYMGNNRTTLKNLTERIYGYGENPNEYLDEICELSPEKLAQELSIWELGYDWASRYIGFFNDLTKSFLKNG